MYFVYNRTDLNSNSQLEAFRTFFFFFIFFFLFFFLRDQTRENRIVAKRENQTRLYRFDVKGRKRLCAIDSLRIVRVRSRHGILNALT